LLRVAAALAVFLFVLYVVRAAVVLILMVPTLLPPVARQVSTFPMSGGVLSSNVVWWTVLGLAVGAVACTVNGRTLPRLSAARR